MRGSKLLVVLLAVACGPIVGGGGGSTDTGTGGSTTSTTAPGTSVGTTAGTTVGTTVGTTSDTGETSATTQPDTGSSEDTFTFIGESGTCFTHCTMVECDPFAQDCPRGEKCMPWANDGGTVWNSTKCSPLAPDPKQPGEPCTVEGSGVSGIDDCDLGAMCFWVDPDTNTGECVALCTGTAADPLCEAECDHCMIGGDSVLTLCLPLCNPLAQDCGGDRGCYPDSDEFLCMSQLGAVAAGESCGFANECVAGTFCADPSFVPGCAGPGGCCAPFCDTISADPCPGAPPEVECMPWWAMGQAPTDECGPWDTIGACGIPP